MAAPEKTVEASSSFFDEPNVTVKTIPVGPGVPLGIESVSAPNLGIGGAYGAWGQSFDNEALREHIEQYLGEPLTSEYQMNLGELGFTCRHHTPNLSHDENLEMEVEAGSSIIRRAIEACGWLPSQVDGLLVGFTAPLSENVLERMAERAGIRANALMVSVHKACDGSVSSLHMALNPNLGEIGQRAVNLAQELKGKKVLVGGIEGLSRYLSRTRDKYAHQLFGTAAGIIGVIPGETMKFLAGATRNVFDSEGQLQVHMFYPHHGNPNDPDSLVEVTEIGTNSFRVAGLMHEPTDGSSVSMAGPMGMVKLFVRSGVEVVKDAYQAYQGYIEKAGQMEKSISVAIVHHANYKINKLIEKNLQREGIRLNMPWLLSEFGNVSAASNMIAFLRQLPVMQPGDHVLVDGFGAGTYYDVVALELSA